MSQDDPFGPCLFDVCPICGACVWVDDPIFVAFSRCSDCHEKAGIEQGHGDIHASGPPYQRHSATSREAAQTIEPRAATLRRRVLDYLRKCKVQGATRQEIEAALNMSGNTVRPRVCELVEMGLVRETMETRLTPSGRRAFVLVANEK